MEENDQRQAFINLLESLYGPYKYDSALFGSTNFSSISTDLCYSNSHFTKLISGSASSAMYERAEKNINRLITLHRLELEVSQSNEAVLKRSKSVSWVKYLSLPVMLLVGMGIMYGFLNKPQIAKTSEAHPLDVYFKFNDASYYKSPYLNDEQVNEYCPGSAFEGRWDLEENYVIPIPYKVPGLYYVGKSADVRLKCKKSTSEEMRGRELIGFENIQNEIWFDKTLTPVTPKYFDTENRKFKPEFKNIDFENDPNFVKIADVYSCFFDEILITADSIYRKGEPCGRYANPENEEIHKEYNLDLNHIIEYIIGNMNFATCQPLENIYCNPNDLANGKSLLVFPCQCSIKTENLGLGGSYPYTKSIRLVEQNYQSNVLCDCNSDI